MDTNLKQWLSNWQVLFGMILILMVNEQQEIINVLNDDVNDMAENKWAEAYVGDMVYERVCGNKEVTKVNGYRL